MLNNNFETIENITEIADCAEPEEIHMENTSTIADDIEDMVTEPGKALKCPFCNWKTHKNAKDKHRGLKNHMKKCKHNPQNIQEIQQEKNTINFVPKSVEDIVEKIEDEIKIDNSETKDKLLSDLDLLQIKFSHIKYNWNYSTNSSVDHLKRQKHLFMRVLTDAASTESVFNLLCLASGGIERGVSMSGLANIDGYGNDVKDNKDEIYPLLKQLIDTGQLSVSMLTPELRLGIVMVSLGINRMEKNNAIDHNFLEQHEDDVANGEYM